MIRHGPATFTGHGAAALRDALAPSAPSNVDRSRPSETIFRWGGRKPRIGVIHNAKARHNIGGHQPSVIAGCYHGMPLTHEALHDVLAGFVANDIDVVIVDGGDGTVRDIISAMRRDFPQFRPHMAIVPSGKTNALALDLGVRADWTLKDALEAVVLGRIEYRAPIEVRRGGSHQVELAGFIFGNGAYVRATQTAQEAHRFGAFNGLAVGLSIIAGVGQTLLGGRENAWRRGEMMRIAVAGEETVEGAQYLVFASTLERMPLGIKPLGVTRPGLKMLRVEAPVRHLAWAMPVVLSGAAPAWLEKAGYHRREAGHIDISFAGPFVLDGETFDGGDVSLRRGFLIPFIVQ